MKLFIDIKANKGNTKGLLFILFFRLSSFFTRNYFLKIVGIPIRAIYKVGFEWLLGIEIPDTTIIGPGLKVLHGQGLVVNSKSILGKNITLRHNTTIGNSVSGGLSARLDDNVVVGANAVIIGDITIGKNSVVGAGSVVIRDVPENSIVAGNPAKIIRTNN